MTVTINANSTLRRHCEVKEKITGERKNSSAEAMSLSIPAMFLLKAAPVLYFLISPVIIYDGSWGHEPWRGRQIISVYYFIDACQGVCLGNSF